ncbi:class F sortase [Plantactinospora sp. CA-290183]|uniref:class F sortase n=1 Tax=Plantactinospora sp. CA-290183 TaxID=3240006 RepID=UPI003D8CF96C
MLSIVPAGPEAPRRRWPIRPPGAAGPPGAVILALCAVVGAVLGIAVTPDAAPPSPAPAAAPLAAPPAATCPPDCVPRVGRPVEPTPSGPPTRVRIPRVRLDAALTPLRLDRAGRLVPPADFTRAGWYVGGAAPGDVGPAVLAGHLDSRTGPAVFHRLPELRPGDRVEVRRGGDWLRFRVTASSRYAKDDFPTAAVYGPAPGPELRLVTCSGRFDRRSGHYPDNLVVFAVTDAAAPPG